MDWTDDVAEQYNSNHIERTGKRQSPMATRGRNVQSTSAQGADDVDDVSRASRHFVPKPFRTKVFRTLTVSNSDPNPDHSHNPNR